MSIHKSQGSEFQVVILPVTKQSGRLLQRNLIYTAITRSKSKLIMLGEFQAFSYAIQNKNIRRNTYLVERFQENQVNTLSQKSDHSKNSISSQSQADGLPQNYLLTSDNINTIDPMIGITEEDLEQFFNVKNT